MNPAERGALGVADLAVADVVGWLQACDWKPRPGRSDFARLWRSRGGEVLVPINSHAPDFQLRMTELLRDLSEITGTRPDALAQEMLARGSDVFEWRASTSDGSQTLPLAAGEEFIQGMAGAYRAVAASTLRRMGHFGRHMPRRAREHTRDLRLGHTRPGSYIIPIITRIAAIEVEPDDDMLIRYDRPEADRDFARSINTLLCEALMATKEVCAAPELPTPATVNGLVVESGVSSELTSSLARIVDAPDITGVEITFGWAAARKPVSSVTFERTDSPVLHTITERLAAHGENRRTTLEVTVRTLSRDRSDVRGAVRFRAKVDGVERTVLAYLDDAQYHIASQANDARLPAYVSGTLVEQDNQAWRLENITDISLQAQDSLVVGTHVMTTSERHRGIEAGPDMT